MCESVEIPVKRITPMVLVCRQLANTVNWETHICGLLRVHRDAFSERLGVVLGRCEGDGTGGNDAILQ